MVQELIKKMLEINPKRRISMKDVMENKWVRENFKNYKKKAYSEILKSMNIDNFKPIFLAFKAKKIRKAIFSHYASRTATIDQIEKYREIFRLIDKDADGELTAEEFKYAMMKSDNLKYAD